MNKPAVKEPSMDEILSSIRQIIADDDAAVAPRRPASLAAAVSAQPQIDSASEGADEADMMADFESAEESPLALTAEQMVPADEPASEPSALDFASFTEALSEPAASEDAAPIPPLVDPEDISFEPEDELLAEAVMAEPAPIPVAPPVQVRPTPPAERPAEPRARSTPSQASPMPDPTLSRDIAEELLEPATNAAVRANLSKLSKLGIGNPGLTIEAMMRDMLRPMLKEWLDENLPSVVERMVEKEIARISRGVE